VIYIPLHTIANFLFGARKEKRKATTFLFFYILLVLLLVAFYFRSLSPSSIVGEEIGSSRGLLAQSKKGKKLFPLSWRQKSKENDVKKKKKGRNGGIER
jgi:hypothetical protein